MEFKKQRLEESARLTLIEVTQIQELTETIKICLYIGFWFGVAFGVCLRTNKE